MLNHNYENSFYYLVKSTYLYSVRGLERMELGSHEIRTIHSAPSLGQSIVRLQKKHQESECKQDRFTSIHHWVYVDGLSKGMARLTIGYTK